MQLICNLPHYHFSLLMQLHTGHVPLNKYLNHIGQVESLLCLACKDTNETPAHLLLMCPVYELIQHEL
jgi:hypothetical protein